MIQSTGVFEGEPSIAVRTRLHFTVQGLSGGLKGATGTGQVVGQLTTSTDPPGTFNTYYAEILPPH